MMLSEGDAPWSVSSDLMREVVGVPMRVRTRVGRRHLEEVSSIDISFSARRFADCGMGDTELGAPAVVAWARPGVVGAPI